MLLVTSWVRHPVFIPNEKCDIAQWMFRNAKSP